MMLKRIIITITLIITLSSCALFREEPRVVEVPIFVDRELTEQLHTRFEIDQRPQFTQGSDDLVCLDPINRDIMTQLVQDMLFRIRLWEAELGVD